MGQELKTGYCNWCAHNTEHGHYASSPLAGIGHAVARVFAGAGGYGPWYCGECRRVTTVLVPSIEDRSGAPVEALGVPRSSDVQRPLVQGSHAVVISAAASQANSRYSEKFRQAVARRVIEGATTFDQIGRELSVSKKEVWGWIVELYRGDQKQIEQLKRQISSLEESLSRYMGDVEFGEDEPSFTDPNFSNWSTVVVDAQFDRYSKLPGENGRPAP